ncbi:MAG: glutamate--tRNA ligase [Nitrosopumilaceae archaeon]
MDDQIKKEIRKFALQNSVEHNGKTNDKIVLSKILGIRADLRKNVKEVQIECAKIVKEINSISLSEQESEIKTKFPELLTTAKKTIEQREGLPPLEDAIQGKVVTRFPPEPNGYPHIGHAKAAIINEEYAKMYGGKSILRMDDTNPENERLEFYAAIKVGLEWLGIKYDQIKNTSDDLEILYEKGEEIINLNRAYVCTCKREAISKNRHEMKSCKCSQLEPNQNQERWKKLFEGYSSGQAIVRFRGDMKSQNTVMRDPVLFRIVEGHHPLLAGKYRVWPSYDFAVAIEDSLDGVTHAFRSKEYELRNELYYAILDALKMRKPKVLEFSRLEFKGMPVSKRVIKPLIEEGKISWYDDPRLPTLEALKKRGITPQAIRKFTLSLSFTKADTLAPFDTLESFNRKEVDPTSIRLYLVKNPRKLFVKNLPSNKVELPNHPANDLGKRTVEHDGNIFLDSDDVKNFSEGSKIRLMGLGNVKINQVNNDLEGEYIGDDVKVDFPKMQWVPQKNSHKLKILIPNQLFIDESFNENSLEELDVFTEPHYLKLKDGSEIQFVRFGYCRKDSVNQAIYTHK